jgi:RNA polymerase sigma factor (sigma-70 family)
MAKTPGYTDANSGIIERCKNGEHRAFMELYNRYAKAMFNISFRILNNRAEAEEVLQDSFLKVFEKIATYDPAHSFGAWLKRIVINGSLDVLKKRKQVLLPLDEVPHAQEEEEEEPASDNYREGFDVDTIKTCVAELPDGYRSILLLFLFEDYSHKEIAGLLGISEGTSKSQYSRARKKLMELLKQKKTAHER